MEDVNAMGLFAPAWERRGEKKKEREREIERERGYLQQLGRC
jgi:hypothetical protein